MGIRTTTPELPALEDNQQWPPQGEWTYEDYLRLPDDGRRYEIIEGVLYVTNAPSYDHQFTVTRILLALATFVESNRLGIVLPAPFEIHLPGIARPVLPDVVFINAERQPQPGDKNFEGAPDLIVEVLSPGTIRVDQSIKLDAYERAGLCEYWIADTKTRSITVYTLPAGGHEYALLGQFTSGETVQSNVLSGLELPIANLFA